MKTFPGKDDTVGRVFYLIAEHWRENVATDFVLYFSLHCGPISGHVKVVVVRVCFIEFFHSRGE